MRPGIIALVVACILCSLAPAQSTEGLITGRVRDRSSGHPLIGAKVEALSPLLQARREVPSNGQGYYYFPQLPPGAYQITVTMAEYQTREVHNLVLPVAGYLQIDFDLRPLRDVWELGYYRTVILRNELILPFFGPDVDPAYVSHFDPGVGTTGQFEPSVSEVIDPRLIDKLPLAGRDVYSALVLLPGVTSDAATVRSLGLSANGQRPTSSTFLLDGLDHNNHVTTGTFPVPPEAVQEYRVSTNNFSAEYGGTSGYIANAVTRRGGPEWHGILYANTQHRVLNANSFQHNANGIARQPFRELQDGFWAGGPLPWKGFFAAAALEYFNSSGLADPLTLRLPTEQFVRSLPAGSTAARLFQEHPPVKFAPGSGDSGLVPLSQPIDLTRWSGLTRLDYEPSGRQHIMVGVFPERLSRPAFIWTPYGQGGLRQSSTSVSVVATSAWSPSLSSELRAGFESDSLGWDVANADLPVLRLSAGALLPSAYSGLVYHDRSHVIIAGGGVIRTAGKHVWKAGGGLSVRALRDLFEFKPRGEYDFTVAGFRVDQPFTVQLPVSRTALLSGAVSPTVPGGNYRYARWSAYFQEDYRATPNVTLNAGIRYEWLGAPHASSDTHDVRAVLPADDPRQNPSAISLQPAGSRVFETSSNAWAGRFGVSYAPPLAKRIVTIRAGYGMFYDPLYDNLWSTITGNDSVFASFNVGAVSQTRTCKFGGDYLSSPPAILPSCLAGTNDFLRVTTFAAPLNPPLVHSFFLGAQAKISTGWSFEVNGIGSTSTNPVTTDVLNRDTGRGRPNLKLPDIYYRANEGFSTYAALTISALYQGERGGLRTFYTWSRSIDNQSDPLLGDFFDLGFSNQTDRGGPGYTGAFTLPNSRDADRGNSDFDQRSNWVVFSYWEPPGLPGKIAGAFSRNWRIAQTLVVRSGLPYSVYAGFQPCQPVCNTRANLLAPGLVSAVTGNVTGGKALLNPAAFSVPPDGTNGNSGRNAFTGPGFWNLDLSLGRTLALPRLRESTRLEVRADAFNVLNHANLQPPANFLGAFPDSVFPGFGTALFGRTGKAGFPALTPFVENARQVQILVRLQF
jgi:Carboxypeptidase regulatory-like domain/TonB dependent receptor-like, beta-barrel/TonB-dependent Receptor Plug Domain